LLWAVELVADKATKTPSPPRPGLTAKVSGRHRERVFVYPGGVDPRAT